MSLSVFSTLNWKMPDEESKVWWRCGREKKTPPERWCTQAFREKNRFVRKNSLEKPGWIIWGLHCICKLQSVVSITTLHSQQPNRYHSLFKQKEPQRCLKLEVHFNTAFLAFLLPEPLPRAGNETTTPQRNAAPSPEPSAAQEKTPSIPCNSLALFSPTPVDLQHRINRTTQWFDGSSLQRVTAATVYCSNICSAASSELGTSTGDTKLLHRTELVSTLLQLTLQQTDTGICKAFLVFSRQILTTARKNNAAGANDIQQCSVLRMLPDWQIIFSL